MSEALIAIVICVWVGYVLAPLVKLWIISAAYDRAQKRKPTVMLAKTDAR